MPEPDYGQLDRLLTRLVDKTITGEDFAALETLLSGDAGAQERYMHYLGLHADLQDIVEKPELQIEQGGEEIFRADRRSRAMVWLTGTAVALFLLGWDWHSKRCVRAIGLPVLCRGSHTLIGQEHRDGFIADLSNYVVSGKTRMLENIDR